MLKHSTFTIERQYPATPEQVFSAFADPAKKRRWFAGGEGTEVLEFEMDFRVGGTVRSRFRMGASTPLPGVEITNDTTYLDIVPHQRIILAYTMSIGGTPFSASLATIEFRPADKGTTLLFTEQGAFLENSDGPERREQGWQKLLERLAQELQNAR